MQLVIDRTTCISFHVYAFQSYCTRKMYRHLRQKSMEVLSEGKRQKSIALDAISNNYEGSNPRKTPALRSFRIFTFSGGQSSLRSKKRSINAQSTLETEFIDGSFPVREPLWLRKLVMEMGVLKASNLITLLFDNQGSLSTAKHRIWNDRT